MKKSIITLGIIAASALGVMSSCQDMLTIETGDKAYVNANDTLYSYLGIMRAMQDVAERQVILGEIRGDLVSSTEYTTDTLHAISNFDNPQDQTCSMLQVSDYYNVINNCNFYIHNCDTSAVKSNVKFMIPEYAQVKAIRAWAYLQLVKNYKEVPYITEPISNLSVIKNFDYSNNLVNKENLVDKLIEDGLTDFVDTRYPGYGTGTAYGTWDNGAVAITSRLCFIPVRVILGDLYLLRGNSQSDYEKAAQYYYDYLKNEAVPQPLSYIEATNYRNGIVSGITLMNGYGDWGATYNYNTEAEVISLIPSSANSGLGKMLTRVADIFGYTPTSSQSRNDILDDNNESTGDTETGGVITVTRNYKRQYGPSEAYNDVVNDQTAVFYPRLTNGTYSAIPSYIDNYDARNILAVESYNYEGVGYPLCSKAASGGEFFYTIPIYRKSLIWLRLAEAINRAGFPEYAFGILKDGLNQYNLPRLVDRYDPVLDEHGYMILQNSRDNITVYFDPEVEEPVYFYYDETGSFVEYPEKVSGSRWELKCDTIPEGEIGMAGSHSALFYVTDLDQIAKFSSFLDFTDDIWNSTYGIHARGAGFGNYTSPNSSQGHLLSNITGTMDVKCFDYYTLIEKQNVDPFTAPKADIINAVENIIVDELALETCFEGNRFTDLIRIADHKNAAGQDGTEWLAKKIANRGSRKATSKTPAIEKFDSEIYNKLKNQANWYFQLPAWSAK